MPQYYMDDIKNKDIFFINKSLPSGITLLAVEWLIGNIGRVSIISNGMSLVLS
jgi:hypothetical protein